MQKPIHLPRRATKMVRISVAWSLFTNTSCSKLIISCVNHEIINILLVLRHVTTTGSEKWNEAETRKRKMRWSFAIMRCEHDGDWEEIARSIKERNNTPSYDDLTSWTSEQTLYRGEVAVPWIWLFLRGPPFPWLWFNRSSSFPSWQDSHQLTFCEFSFHVSGINLLKYCSHSVFCPSTSSVLTMEMLLSPIPSVV